MDDAVKKWFELSDVRRRYYAKFAWIPLYGGIRFEKVLDYPAVGFREDYFTVGSALIFGDCRSEAESVEWHFWSMQESQPYFDSANNYHTAESFDGGTGKTIGLKLVLSNFINSVDGRAVIVNQDFLMAYGLIFENGKWLRPSTGYEEVMRSRLDEDGNISLVECRSEYIRDYAAARNSSLRIYYFRQRQAVFSNRPDFTDLNEYDIADEEHDRCKVHIREVGKDGETPGVSWSVLKIWREDVDPDEEIPQFAGYEDSDIKTEHSSGVSKTDVINYHVIGEMWRGEWIEPSGPSQRIGSSEPAEQLFVFVDATGQKIDLEQLNYDEVGRYLWFKPDVANAILSCRASSLNWYTHDTGSLSISPGVSVHFGLNQLGLCNVYAYDIARLPVWQRRIWVSQNVPPDGGVSSELLDAQMRTNPASTRAPETLVIQAVEWLDNCFVNAFGRELYKTHPEKEILLRSIHRFKAIDEVSLRSLGKDLYKFSLESIDHNVLKEVLNDVNSKMGSLKLLEALLARATDKAFAHSHMAPLFGLYDLRKSDAHLASSDVESSYDRIGVPRDRPFIIQAVSMLKSVADTIGVIGTQLRSWAARS